MIKSTPEEMLALANRIVLRRIARCDDSEYELGADLVMAAYDGLDSDVPGDLDAHWKLMATFVFRLLNIATVAISDLAEAQGRRSTDVLPAIMSKVLELEEDAEQRGQTT